MNKPAAKKKTPELGCVVLLPSIHFVLKAEQLFKQQQVVHDLVPVPRKISSDCGMALAVVCEQLELINALLAEKEELSGYRLFRRDENENYSSIDI